MIADIHPLPPAPPAIVYVATAPNAGAAGSADAGTSAAPPPAGKRVAKSDSGGQLASPAVPGGTNHAPVTGAKPKSFSAPAKQD